MTKKFVRRKLKNHTAYILNLVKEVQTSKKVKENNQTLLKLFNPLLKKLSRRYFNLFGIDICILYEFLEVESLSLFLEYKPELNNNFPAYFKTLLDKRLLYFCQKSTKLKNVQTDNYNDLEDIAVDDPNVMIIGNNKTEDFKFLLDIDRSELFRKVAYYLLFRNFKEVEIAKKLNYSQSRISQIIHDIKKEIKKKQRRLK